MSPWLYPSLHQCRVNTLNHQCANGPLLVVVPMTFRECLKVNCCHVQPWLPWLLSVRLVWGRAIEPNQQHGVGQAKPPKPTMPICPTTPVVSIWSDCVEWTQLLALALVQLEVALQHAIHVPLHQEDTRNIHVAWHAHHLATNWQSHQLRNTCYGCTLIYMHLIHMCVQLDIGTSHLACLRHTFAIGYSHYYYIIHIFNIIV